MSKSIAFKNNQYIASILLLAVSFALQTVYFIIKYLSKEDDTVLYMNALSIISYVFFLIGLLKLIMLLYKQNKAQNAISAEKQSLSNFNFNSIVQNIENHDVVFQTIFNQITDAVMLIKDNRFIDCNETAVQIFGLKSKSDINNLSPGDLSPEYQADGQFSSEKAKKMIEICHKTGSNRFEWQHKKKDGTIFWMDIMLTTIKIKNQEFIHVIGRDITEIKNAQDELKYDKNYLNDILIQLPFPILIFSSTQSTKFFNHAFEKTFGYQLSDIKNSKIWWEKSITDQKQRKIFRENWEKAVAGSNDDNHISEQQWPIVDVNGEIHECRIVGLNRDNELIVVFSDITKLNELNQELILAREKSEELNRLKSAFLANLSHELRTPMNGILGFAQLLAIPDLEDEDRQNYVDVILKSGERLINMINDIISISKIDAGQVEVTSQDMEVKQAIEEIFDFYKYVAENKGLNFVLNIDKIADGQIIETDEYKTKQILTNLIGNAIKYTPSGEVKIEAFQEDASLKIKVSDTGYGIKKEKYQDVFERFIRLEETSEQTEGTGLGMAISKAYATQLGMQIQLRSEFGVGSEFTLVIPIAENKIQKLSEHKKLKNNEEQIPQLEGKIILVAEDDELNFMVLKLYLEKTNATILRAYNGLEAVEIVKEKSVDFIFMDIKMPIMTGFEAIERIRPENSDMPIIAQTAFTFSEDEEKCRNAGFNSYLSKPLDRKKVYEVLIHYLS